MNAMPELALMAATLGSFVLLKGTVVLMVAALAAWLLRRQSAATRSAVWSAALGVLLVLPAFSWLLPSWQIWTIEDLQPVATTVIPAGMAPSTSSSEIPAEEVAASTAPPPDAAPPQVAAVMAVFLGLLWAAGSFILILRLLLHALRAHRITRRAWPAEQLGLGIAGEGRQDLGNGHPVRILMSNDTVFPCSWGPWEPVVLLPAGADRWPRERTRSVVLHELAHVARGDHFQHLVAELVRALYWPNPLVWLAARRNGLERELACDDLVLERGTPGAEYASHLLQIARLQLEPSRPIGAVAMAARPGFKDRIRSVLNQRIDRTPMGPNRRLLAACMAVVFTLPLATVDLMGLHETGAVDVPGVERLIGDLEAGADAQIRQRAAWWLGEQETRSGVHPLMTALAGDGSPEVRTAAAWALGEIKDTRAIPALIRSLDDDDARVREMAALALGEIEHPSAVKPLVELFDRGAEQRAAVVWALGEIQGDDAERSRREAFARWDRAPWKNGEVWTDVLDSDAHSSEDTATLLDRLAHGDAEQRRAAALSLGHRGHHHHFGPSASVQEVVDALLRALHDPVPAVRAAATWALDEINPSRTARGRRR